MVKYLQSPIHKSFICHASTFFKSALQSTWIESQHQTISLPEDDPKIFGLFLNWLYADAWGVVTKTLQFDSPATTPSFECEALESMILLYIFAGKVQAIKCQQMILADLDRSRSCCSSERSPRLGWTAEIAHTHAYVVNQLQEEKFEDSSIIRGEPDLATLVLRETFGFFKGRIPKR
ncbi:hypothetical protein ANO11243_064380 [Dothideomycetidae sp. 11243]|nr:hypothetical protein ANO11243_064380 [fungal sp. No.11243]